jgi:phosphatidylglycerophosphate synthase
MTNRKKLQLGIYKIINPLVRLLIKAGLTPNMVTTIGLVLNIGVAIIFISGAEEGKRGDLRYVGWAGALILFAGLFDMLDGQVARLGNMSSPFGALYDSVLDRYSELILFLGICYYLVAHHYFLSSLFAFIGLIGSMMVSYTRARAEGLGIECKDGLMQRPERVIIVGVSALACGVASGWLGGNFKISWPDSTFPVFETISIFTIPVTVMAFLANWTAIGRLRDARRTLQARETAASSSSVVQLRTPERTTEAGLTGDTTTATEGPQADKASGVTVPGVNPRKSLPGALLLLICLHAVFSGFTSRAQSSTTQLSTSQSSTADASHVSAPVKDAVDTFPVPPHNANSLFYLQRTPNTNTIICELNEKDGQLDKDEPVHVLWIRYAEQKQREELTFIQRHFAYGLKEKDLGNNVYELHFVSYKKILFYLMKSPVDNRPHVFATITGRQAILNRIYVKINPGGTFWSPNVEYLELKGVDTGNGKELTQRFKV